MVNIRLLNKISPEGLAQLDSTKYACSEEGSTEDQGIILRSASMHDMDIPSHIRAIARAGAGVNNIPIDKCSQQGIVVFNTPGGNANAVKEMVMTGLLLSARKVYPGMQWVQTLKGQPEVPKLVEKGKGKFVGPELMGKKLGVIGLGAIGVLVCNLAHHFGMEVYGYDPYLSIDSALKLTRSVHRVNSLKEIYSNCDFITLHVPLGKETKGMINSQSIATMKHGVRIMNFSRGELVETQDILAALDEKNVYCYVTDFPNDDLLGHPGVLALPHLGASTPESEDVCASMAASQLRDFLENGNIKNSVNIPDLHMERTGGERVTLFHQNIPETLAKYTGVFASHNINIRNLINKSKGEYAYTVLDLDGHVPPAVLEQLEQAKGIIRVTLLK
ncbi:phosphoglycerate dehydrogenase [Oscillospiraceae bacterium MB08-C2-2]|nr:phosphoglycerate dehydrogenase [Oscillospiraceae bacterium MB08-C2-2]